MLAASRRVSSSAASARRGGASGSMAVTLPALRGGARCLTRRAFSNSTANGAANGASNGSTHGEKSVKETLEFVKNIKEIFSSGTSQEGAGLSATVAKMDERIKVYTNIFFGASLIVVPASLVINTWLYFQQSEVTSLKEKQKTLEETVQAIDKRVCILEYASAYNEKQQLLNPKKPEACSGKAPDA